MIYLDNAATTKVSDEAYKAMKIYFRGYYGNPSSMYGFATKIREDVERARKQVSDLINADPSNIYFTSGGSESDNWILKSVLNFCSETFKPHIITSAIEHHAILNTCKFLEEHGCEVTYLPVNKDGFVEPALVEKSIQKNTRMISIMMANNEIGTIQDIKTIGKIAKEQKIFFHTDAVQAFGHIPIDVKDLNIDALSASGHKFNAPKGIGILYLKDKRIESLVHGGGQEDGMRAGTYNVPGIIGIGEAARLADEKMESRHNAEVILRDYLGLRILSLIEGTSINGSTKNRLSNNLNIRFDGVEGIVLATLLDQEGICCSTGSACNTDSGEPSHCLKAIGLTDDEANSSLRFTVSEDNTIREMDKVVEVLKHSVELLRGRE